MTYEDLLEECTSLGIKVKETNLKSSGGRCHGNKIAINKKIQTNAQKNCILSEELGHYHRTIGNILNENDINNRKQEIIARRWGYEKLCGLDKIADAILKGAKNKYEIAEYLNVTDEFFQKSIEYLSLKYGDNAYCKGILFIFRPNFSIVQDFGGLF